MARAEAIVSAGSLAVAKRAMIRVVEILVI